MRRIAVAAIATIMVGSGCGSDRPPTNDDRQLVQPPPPRVATSPEASSPSASTTVRTGPIAESDVIGQYSQDLAWVGAAGVPSTTVRELGRTLRIAAEGTVTIALDANGEVRARGKWSIEDDTVVLRMEDGVMRGSIKGDILTIKVRSKIVDAEATTTWTRKATPPK